MARRQLWLGVGCDYAPTFPRSSVIVERLTLLLSCFSSFIQKVSTQNCIIAQSQSFYFAIEFAACFRSFMLPIMYIPMFKNSFRKPTSRLELLGCHQQSILVHKIHNSFGKLLC
jgi:hypothetical protein